MNTSKDLVVHYGICSGENYSELAGLVNEQISNGYQPLGGPYTCEMHNVQYIQQAMVKYGTIKKKKSDPRPKGHHKKSI